MSRSRRKPTAGEHAVSQRLLVRKTTGPAYRRYRKKRTVGTIGRRLQLVRLFDPADERPTQSGTVSISGEAARVQPSLKRRHRMRNDYEFRLDRRAK
ncbi:MAG: hypothetical protein ABW185_00400 [Sedimenticola sp.]